MEFSNSNINDKNRKIKRCSLISGCVVRMFQLKFLAVIKLYYTLSTTILLMQTSRLTNIIYSTAKRCINTKKWYGGFRSIWNDSNPIFTFHTSNKYYLSASLPLKNQNIPKNFSEFITDQSILSKLQKNGITKMFPVQQETFKLIQSGIDILASDRTGSGKTLGYTLPVLQKFNKANYHLTQIKNPKFLILCPTRQLVLQVSNQIKKVNSVYKVVSIYGGSPIDRQISDINRGIAIVVATPGRLIDLLKRKSLRLNDLEVVCIDQADTMLEKGFKDDVEEIFQFVRNSAGQTQNIMFSATIPVWVNKIAKQYFNKNMKRINMVKDQDVKTSQTVQHYALYVKRSQRHKIVESLIEKYNPQNRTIIFTRMKVEADDFMYQFKNNKIAILHGDVPQRAREQNINHFRRGTKRVLIATDIAARGIDIPDVELIIQLSPPQNSEQYIHRSGRTGRAGKEGINITLFDQTNVDQLIQAEKSANIKIKIIDDSHNISFWKKKLSRFNNQASLTDVAQKKFIEEFIKKAKLEKEFLENISFLSNKKGFISFIAYTKSKKSTELSDVFQGITIHNQITDNQGIKFDIAVNEYSDFQQAIDRQKQFQVQEYNKYTSMTLRSLAKGLSRRSSGSEYNRNSSRDFNRRSESRQQRYGNSERSNRNRGQEQENRYGQQRRNRYENREDRQSKTRQTKSVSDMPEGLPAYKLFLYGFSPEVSDSHFKDEINNQLGLTNYKLKIIKKVDEEGASKIFGFIEFPNKQDCQKFMESKISLNGEQVKKRIAQDRK